MSANAPIFDRTFEVMKLISENLAKEPGSAALNHYPSLRVQTRNVNDAFSTSLGQFDQVLEDIRAFLQDDSTVSAEVLQPDNPLQFYRHIAPRVIGNLALVARRVAGATMPEPKLTSAELTGICGDFNDYCELTTTVRQFVDTLVETSYVIASLQPKYLNYRVLESLLSFVVVAPPSLQVPIYSKELEAIVREYAQMSVGEKKNSAFTHASREQFPQRVEFLCRLVSPSYHKNIEGNLNSVFKFCSEFAHIGYVPALVSGGGKSGNFLLRGEDDGDVYIPRAENFAELKLQLLRECAIFYADIFLRAFEVFASRMLSSSALSEIVAKTSSQRDSLFTVLRLTLRKLVEPIAKGQIGSSRTIEIKCNCGGKVTWKPPHDDWDNYCPQCGARFTMMEVDRTVAYVISELGPGDVLGGWAEPMHTLPPPLKEKLKSIWQIHKHELSSGDGKHSTKFILIGDLVNIDVDTLKECVQVLRVPPDEIKAMCDLYAFVSDGGMRANDHINIVCNCGSLMSFDRPYTESHLNCRCGQVIGIMVVSGDPIAISGSGPDSAERELPVQGSRRRF